jgi:GntR family transcriptional regulator
MNSIHDQLLRVWLAAAEAGTPLPSESILATTLGVSRPKVREELIRLESGGLVTRVPNSGTFPNRSALEVGLRLDQSYEFSSMLEHAGFRASVEVLEASWRTVDTMRAQRLGVRPGVSAFETVKRWSANGQPVMIATDIIPATKTEGPDLDPAKGVFELVRELRKSTVEWESTWVKAKVADARETELLTLGASESVLEINMIGISVLGAKLYFTEETHRQGIVPYGMVRTVPSY